jgi:hypothetical protein
MDQFEEADLVCPVGHSRGRALIETLLKVKEELEEYRRPLSPREAGELVARNSPEPTAATSVLQLHHRLNQMEDKIDLITEVLVTTIQQLKLSNDVFPSVESKGQQSDSRRSSHSKHHDDYEDGNLTYKLDEVVTQMTQEFLDLNEENNRIQRLLSQSKNTSEEIDLLKEELIVLKTQMVRKEQQLLQIKSFRDALKQQENGHHEAGRGRSKSHRME